MPNSLTYGSVTVMIERPGWPKGEIDARRDRIEGSCGQVTRGRLSAPQMSLIRPRMGLDEREAGARRSDWRLGCRAALKREIAPAFEDHCS